MSEMSEKLIIRLPTTRDAQVHWLIADATAEEVIASGVLPSLEHLSELTEKASNRSLYVTVASNGISLLEAAVPAKSRRHLQNIIPFTLEDDVAQDIDELHFAWPSHTPANQPIPVAVVAKSRMSFWLDALQEAGLQVSRLIPDVLLLPYEQDRWTVAAFDSHWLIRQGAWQGVQLDPEWLEHLAYPEDELPAELLTLGEVHWPEHVPVPAPTRALAQDLPLLALLKQWDTATLNLCQGAFTQEQRQSMDWDMLRWPAAAAALFMLAYISNLGVTWMQLNQQTAHIQQAIESRYLELFPEQHRVPPDVRRRMEQLASGHTGEGGALLLSMLNDLVPAFEEAALEVSLLQFDGNRGELRIQATGKNFNTFERFQREARKQALDIEQGQLVSRSGQIAGRLTVRKPS
ncbi:type II secretion system protein GspL [Aliidiomarina taiwanensis]|nr:type II secretion system protein GspL [Aliidiomarina taiwanensis]